MSSTRKDGGECGGTSTKLLQWVYVSGSLAPFGLLGMVERALAGSPKAGMRYIAKCLLLEVGYKDASDFECLSTSSVVQSIPMTIIVVLIVAIKKF